MTVRKNVTWGLKMTVLGLLMAVAAPASAQNATLSSLIVADMSPAFTAATRTYSIPRTAACAVPVTATLSNAAYKLQIANTDTPSGTMRQAWVCDGRTKIDVVIYSGWTEVGRYTINVVGSVPPPPPPPAPSLLSALVIENLMPAFSPTTFNYTIPRTAACGVPVTATLANSALKLQIQNQDTPSGTMRQAYVCDGKTKIDVVLYQTWTEVGRYTVTLVGNQPPPPPPVPVTPPPPPFEATPAPSPAPGPFTDPLPTPYPADQQTAARFLGQASFGATSADMLKVQTSGIDYWLAQQFKTAESQVADGLDINALRGQVVTNMATGQDQLRQRVAFALSQIFVVSANKNTNGSEMIPWVRLLSTHAFGNYRALLREATISPSMGKFLDLANSIGGAANAAPNENFPREAMQLFSVGVWKLNQDGTFKTDAQGLYIPTYNQSTILEVARALSGWTYPTAPGAAPRSQNPPYFVGVMEPRPGSHDRGAKTILGVSLQANQTVTADMEQVVDILFNHANTPPFVATRLIRALATSNPSTDYIRRVADVFVNNGQGVRGDLKAVVTAILTDPEAALATSTAGRLMDPVLNAIALGRALDAQIGDPNMFMYLLFNLGQHPLTPASVFSFYSPLAPLPGNALLYGPEFMVYPPALAVQRASFTWALISNQFGSAFQVNTAPFVQLAGNPSALVELVNQKVLHGRMSNELRDALITSVLAVSDPTQRALGAIYLAAISSEFVVQTGA